MTETASTAQAETPAEDTTTTQEVAETSQADAPTPTPNDMPSTADVPDSTESATESSPEEDTDDVLHEEALDTLDSKVRRRVHKVQRENVNLRNRLKTAEAEYTSVQTENLRLTTALEKGVPGHFLKFLHGANREELEQNADELMKAVGMPMRVTPSQGPQGPAGVLRQPDEPEPAPSLSEIGQRIYRR